MVYICQRNALKYLSPPNGVSAGPGPGQNRGKTIQAQKKILSAVQERIASLYPRPSEVKDFLRCQNTIGMLHELDKAELIEFLTATGFRKKLYG